MKQLRKSGLRKAGRVTQGRSLWVLLAQHGAVPSCRGGVRAGLNRPRPRTGAREPVSPPRAGRVLVGARARARAAYWESARAPAILSYRLLCSGGFAACERAEETGGGVAGVFFGGCQGWWEQPPEESTMISAAQLLDELMGRDRNLAPDEKRSNVRWDHESVSPAGLGFVPRSCGGGEWRGLGPPGPSSSWGPGPHRVWLSDPGGGKEPGQRPGREEMQDTGIRDNLFLFGHRGSQRGPWRELKSTFRRQGKEGEGVCYLFRGSRVFTSL